MMMEVEMGILVEVDTESHVGDRQRLITTLNKLVTNPSDSCSDDHEAADKALLEYIGDKAVTMLFSEVHKYYA